MISASKTTFIHYNLNILMPKVTKNIKNLSKKFCEFRPRAKQGQGQAGRCLKRKTKKGATLPPKPKTNSDALVKWQPLEANY